MQLLKFKEASLYVIKIHSEKLHQTYCDKMRDFVTDDLMILDKSIFNEKNRLTASSLCTKSLGHSHVQDWEAVILFLR